MGPSFFFSFFFDEAYFVNYDKGYNAFSSESKNKEDKMFSS